MYFVLPKPPAIQEWTGIKRDVHSIYQNHNVSSNPKRNLVTQNLHCAMGQKGISIQWSPSWFSPPLPLPALPFSLPLINFSTASPPPALLSSSQSHFLRKKLGMFAFISFHLSQTEHYTKTGRSAGQITDKTTELTAVWFYDYTNILVNTCRDVGYITNFSCSLMSSCQRNVTPAFLDNEDGSIRKR